MADDRTPYQGLPVLLTGEEARRVKAIPAAPMTIARTPEAPVAVVEAPVEAEAEAEIESEEDQDPETPEIPAESSPEQSRGDNGRFISEIEPATDAKSVDLGYLLKPELVALANEKGIDSSGTKSELLARLREAGL